VTKKNSFRSFGLKAPSSGRTNVMASPPWISIHSPVNEPVVKVRSLFIAGSDERKA
jgi:hypothetical protein